MEPEARAYFAQFSGYNPDDEYYCFVCKNAGCPNCSDEEWYRAEDVASQWRLDYVFDRSQWKLD